MNTPATETAIQSAILVNDALSNYISVHDYAFRSQATIGSMIRNFFGRGPNFEELYEQAVGCDEHMSHVQERLLENFSKHIANLTTVEQDFFGAMVPYVAALKQTTSLLYRRQYALLAKRNGSPLNLTEYKQIEEEYQQAVQHYMRLATNIQLRSELLMMQH